jgi:hypothetical protein
MSLQDELAKLQRDNEALKAEMATPDNSTENINKLLSELIPDAIAQISFLVKHSDSDAVRLNASKYVLELHRTSASTEDTLAKLLKELAPTNS